MFRLRLKQSINFLQASIFTFINQSLKSGGHMRFELVHNWLREGTQKYRSTYLMDKKYSKYDRNTHNSAWSWNGFTAEHSSYYCRWFACRHSYPNLYYLFMLNATHEDIVYFNTITVTIGLQLMTLSEGLLALWR